MASLPSSEPPREPPPQTPPVPAVESSSERLRRHGRQARLYAWAVTSVALLTVLIVLISRNVRGVKLDWVFGSTHASLVWIILAAAVLGWLLGIATSVVFRHRTRTPH
jgi:uncharacterized integral membrane protein